jgi:hypothetical protein
MSLFEDNILWLVILAAFLFVFKCFCPTTIVQP